MGPEVQLTRYGAGLVGAGLVGTQSAGLAASSSTDAFLWRATQLELYLYSFSASIAPALQSLRLSRCPRFFGGGCGFGLNIGWS